MPSNITDKVDMSKVQLLSCFKSISKGEIPRDGQPVFYVFNNTAYQGFYESCKEPEFGKHIFYGSHGFLCDDVDLWIARNGNNAVLEAK